MSMFQVWTKRSTGPAGRQRVIYISTSISVNFICWPFSFPEKVKDQRLKSQLQVDITARLLEGNNGDRESLVYRTVIQVNRFRAHLQCWWKIMSSWRIGHDFTLFFWNPGYKALPWRKPSGGAWLSLYTRAFQVAFISLSSSSNVNSWIIPQILNKQL